MSFQFFKRAIDLTRVMGVEVMGTPIGGMSYEDARDNSTRQRLYETALDYIKKLAAYGKEKGLKEIQIEATPLITEFPHDPETSVKLMEDLEGKTDIPVRLLIDWGHALFKPLLKEKADMELWLKSCSLYVSAIHLQQTDGQWDRHWDFTKPGILSTGVVKEVTKNCDMEHIVQYLEVVTIFEDSDEAVYSGMKQSMDMLHKVFDS
ncbi:MAG: TIM barrel protein [Bacillota bacterium]|nr:TIM barrel protein [Bacillota bacterium]